MEVGFPVAPRDAPRCNLWGHGVFKGAWWRMDGRQGGRKERRGRRRVCSELRLDGQDGSFCAGIRRIGGVVG